MEKETLEKLKERSKLVKQRLTALVKEENSLNEEDALLDELIGFYDKLDFDSIEAERSLTEKLVSGEKPEELVAVTEVKKLTKRNKKSGTSKYYEVFKLILNTGNEEGLTAKELTDATNEYMGCRVSIATIHRTIRRAVELGKAKRIGAKYLWIEE